MAIQQINLGSMPLGAGGDSQRAANAKINQNFAQLKSAVFRDVGTADGQIPLAEDIQAVAFGRTIESAPEGVDAANLRKGFIYTNSNTTGLPPQITTSYLGVLNTFAGYYSATGPTDSQYFYSYFDDNIYFRGRRFRDPAYRDWRLIYHSGNTTKDSNGFLKAASPVVDLYDDRIELNSDAERQGGISFKKLGTGNYLVKGSLGFAQEGWYIEMPKDANGNVLVAVVYEQLESNDISIKTYDYMLNKKGRVVPDIEIPLDIPEGRCINLRLHEAKEQLDEPIE